MPYPFFINEYDEEVGKILLLNYELRASKVRSILQNGNYFTQYYIAFYNKYYKRVDTKSVFFKEDHSIVLEYLELEKEEDNRLKEKEKLKIKAKKEREKLKAKKQKEKSKKNTEEGNETK